MPRITLEHINKRWNKFYATDDVSMVIEDNAFVTLLGPSGCGKTTILRMIAGLETPTTGKITIGDRVVFDSDMGINVPPNKRKVGFLFQNYALWPNMTVHDNIAFGLANVKETLPKIDFEAKTTWQLGQALSKPAEVKKIVEDCRDKDGKIDEKRALIKLIDGFTISMPTAKKLFAYHVESGKDVSAEAASLIKTAEAAKSSKGLNDNFEYVQNGSVVTEVRKLSKEEIDLAVRRVSRIVKIGMFMDRYPAELSGGQQQRVAIARTLAPEPTVLFMDEPLSNLDAKLRLEMRYELQRLHVETGSTFVYVTHDQMEAMTLATRICLISNGVLQQYDEPLTVYNKPNNTFVADFVGNPAINFMNARGSQQADGSFRLKLLDGYDAVFTPTEKVKAETWYAQAEKEIAAFESKVRPAEKANKDVPFSYPVAMVTDTPDNRTPDREDWVVGVRPEFVTICEDGPVEGEIFSAMPTGMETTVRIRVGNFLLTGVIFGGITYRIGEKVHLRFSGEGTTLFSRENGRLVSTGKLEIE